MRLRRIRAALPAGVAVAMVVAVTVAAGLFLPGCGAAKSANLGADQSLVAIGEGALERAEAMENKGDAADANISYRRALWAFRYHEQLTGEEPLLLDEALDGIERTTSKRRE